MAAAETPHVVVAPTSPTAALDHALQFLAQNEPEECLRHAIPVLTDQGAGASAFDLIGRAAVMLGSMHLARVAFTAAVRSLAREGIAGHSLAAALSVFRLTGQDALLTELAVVFGADAPRTSDAAVRPPPLASAPVVPLARTVGRAELLKIALTEVESAAQGTDAPLPIRQRHGLWGSLPTGAFERFAKVLEVRVCPVGARVLTEGAHGGSVFVVARGEVRVVRGSGADAIPLAVLGPEAVFGELARLTSESRTATVTTARPALLLEASRDALDAAIADVPSLAEVLSAFGRARLVENLRRTSEVLKSVPEDRRESLASRFESVQFTAGQILFAQGDTAPGLHLIVSGKVEAVRTEEGSSESLSLGTVSPGGCLGEVSLVLHRPAAATVRALVPTTALVLRPEHFMEVVRAYPELLAALYELAVTREQDLVSVVAQEAVDADDLVVV